MNKQVEDVVASLTDKGWDVSVDQPKESDGIWWLDVSAYGQSFCIAWKAAHGFGLSSPEPHAFGEGHDESYENPRDLLERLDELVAADRRTVPPRAVVLSRLREFASLTQAQLADRLNVQQAAISKLERRSDMHVSSLARLVEAMGGRLQILAEFDGDAFEIEFVPDSQESSHHPCHVLPHERGWAIQVAGRESAISVHETQREAIEVARKLLKRNDGGALIIHGRDGKIRKSSRVLADASSAV